MGKRWRFARENYGWEVDGEDGRRHPHIHRSDDPCQSIYRERGLVLDLDAIRREYERR